MITNLKSKAKSDIFKMITKIKLKITFPFGLSIMCVLTPYGAGGTL
jgi:hypothetical protein